MKTFTTRPGASPEITTTTNGGKPEEGHRENMRKACSVRPIGVGLQADQVPDGGRHPTTVRDHLSSDEWQAVVAVLLLVFLVAQAGFWAGWGLGYVHGYRVAAEKLGVWG